MSFDYTLADDIDLYVQGRITPMDAQRQMRTAKAVLERLKEQPGIILADEVGMGKTYVALAVALSVAMQDHEHRPVVVMVPPSLQEKWPRDFDLFCQRCLPQHLGDGLNCSVARRTVEFFKFLDDPADRRRSVIFLTHGAMSRHLYDPWVKLALIQRALYRRRNTEKLRKKLGRDLGGLLHLQTTIVRNYPDLLADLLEHSPKKWLMVMRRHGYEPEDHDDPVPALAIDAMTNMDLSQTYELLHALPDRKTKHYKRYIRAVRDELTQDLKTLWKRAINSVGLRLPLLIMDEAHHLKNPHTKLASLFQNEMAEEDAAEVERGPLGGVFERMMFLTATPFQLGHHELCSVLDRFKGIAWTGNTAPKDGLTGFEMRLTELRAALDEAQAAALRLDRAWGVLQPNDLRINDKTYKTIETWWQDIHGEGELSEAAAEVRHQFDQVMGKMKQAEVLLSPWVIRHLRPRQLPSPFTKMDRRRRLVGAAILDENLTSPKGINVQGEALLPFLLAARIAAKSPAERPVFAEGLASSYEAFLYTREMNAVETPRKKFITDEDDDATVVSLSDDDWHLNQLTRLIPKANTHQSATHPKVTATVERVIQLWLAGEKVLVFSHYIATGRVLRSLISSRIDAIIKHTAATKLKCNLNEAESTLERIGDRFFNEESPWRQACDEHVDDILRGYPQLDDEKTVITNVIRRYIRTPSFLVRFFPLEAMKDAKRTVDAAFQRKDTSGFSLGDLLAYFFEFLAVRCGPQERQDYLHAINRIQTGTHYGEVALKTFSDDEIQGGSQEQLLPNVRLVNGGTRRETRQRLMLSFNTPFYPDILIASSVLAEGVDLHLNCRQVIHHDLSWNPSSLEQRNGRIDRIGAKAERCGQPIDIYYPYIAATQDDKMYQVVMDRERWFNVLMGEEYQIDARTTDKLSERLPFPEEAAQALAFDLSVDK